MSTMYLKPSSPIWCTQCGTLVHGLNTNTGRNVPCGHIAPAESICATWTEAEGCVCDVEAADALQAALEEGDRAAIAERKAQALINRADTVWRPNLWCWIGIAVMALLLFGAIATIGVDW